jgi:hypothetical protein
MHHDGGERRKRAFAARPHDLAQRRIEPRITVMDTERPDRCVKRKL